MVVVSFAPTVIQPSSTTLRYTFVVRGERRYIHDSCGCRKYEVEALEAIRSIVEDGGRIESMYEGSLWRPEPPAESVEFDSNGVYRYKVPYLIVADPGFGCPLQCPWCYARPAPVDAPLPNNRSINSAIELLVERVAATLDRLAERHSNDNGIVATVVLGGSIDPLVRMGTMATGVLLVHEFYNELTRRLEDRGWSVEEYGIVKEVGGSVSEVRYAISTSNLLAFLAQYRQLWMLSEVVVTYLPRRLFLLHPFWRMTAKYTSITYDDYVALVEEAARKNATLAYIVFRDRSWNEELQLPNVKAERYFILSFHPSNRQLMLANDIDVPTSRDIYSVLEHVVLELGTRLYNVGLDSCSMIRLGADPRVIHEYETRNMIHCTPHGCRYTRICPRGDSVCVALRR